MARQPALDLRWEIVRNMRAHAERRAHRHAVVSHERGKHAACGLARSDDVNGVGKSGSQMSVGQRACHSATGAGRNDAGARYGQQVLSERARLTRQWALCGSDQADSRVTTSNSRKSSATT